LRPRTAPGPTSAAAPASAHSCTATSSPSPPSAASAAARARKPLGLLKNAAPQEGRDRARPRPLHTRGSSAAARLQSRTASCQSLPTRTGSRTTFLTTTAQRVLSVPADVDVLNPERGRYFLTTAAQRALSVATDVGRPDPGRRRRSQRVLSVATRRGRSWIPDEGAAFLLSDHSRSARNSQSGLRGSRPPHHQAPPSPPGEGARGAGGVWRWIRVS
jgi:hypothetical protein